MKAIHKIRQNKFLKIILILIAIPIVFISIVWIKEWSCPFTKDYNTDQWAAILSAFLGYTGSCALGLLALYQNDRLNYINEKYRNLLLIPYFTFIELDDLTVDYSERSTIHPSLPNICFRYNHIGDEDETKNVYIMGNAVNKSEYQITSIYSKLEKPIKIKSRIVFTIIKEKEEAIYLGSKKSEKICFIIPINEFNGLDKNSNMIIRLEFTNSFGFITKGKIIIERDGNSFKAYYRILQYTGINPYEKKDIE